MPRDGLMVPGIRAQLRLSGPAHDEPAEEEPEPEQQRAFDLLKNLLTDAPVLACPDFSVKTPLQIDASNYGLGQVLTQEIDGQERVIDHRCRAAELFTHVK